MHVSIQHKPAALLVIAVCIATAFAALKIMPLGDSLTEGSDGPESTYRMPLYFMLDSAGIDFDFVGSLNNGPDSLPDKDNDGYHGYTTGQVLSVAPQSTAVHQPDLVLLMVGSNDIRYSRHYSEATLTTYDNLLSQLFRACSDVYILAASIPPIGLAIQEFSVENFNRDLEALVNRRKTGGDRISFVDIFARLTLEDLYDGTHLSRTGNDKTAAGWFDGIMGIISTGAVKLSYVQIAQPTVMSLKNMEHGPEYDLLGRHLHPAGSRGCFLLICNKGRLPVSFRNKN